MVKVLYTAHAHITGGREGHARTADGELEVDLRTPKEMGGAGGGTNPEELFVVGYAASFGSTLGVLARRRRLNAGDITVDSAMSLLPAADGSFQLAATLDVALPSIRNRDTAAQLVREAHQACPYSNATRGNIDVEILLEGKPVTSHRREPQGTTAD
jgi:osmotically inducible protein OsmC